MTTIPWIDKATTNDPLDLVNAFSTCPFGVDPAPMGKIMLDDMYWGKRICELCVQITELNKALKKIKKRKRKKE